MLCGFFPWFVWNQTPEEFILHNLVPIHPMPQSTAPDLKDIDHIKAHVVGGIPLQKGNSPPYWAAAQI